MPWSLRAIHGPCGVQARWLCLLLLVYNLVTARNACAPIATLQCREGKRMTKSTGSESAVIRGTNVLEDTPHNLSGEGVQHRGARGEQLQARRIMVLSHFG